MAHPSQRSRQARFANSPMQAFGTWEPKGRCASASCVPHSGLTTNSDCSRRPAGDARVSRSETATLFFNDLGVLDHCDAAALCQFAFQGDGFAAQIGKLIVHWLMFTHDQIRFALTDDADGTAASDAFGPAGLPVFLTHGVMVDIAHHIDHFALDLFRDSRV